MSSSKRDKKGSCTLLWPWILLLHFVLTVVFVMLLSLKTLSTKVCSFLQMLRGKCSSSYSRECACTTHLCRMLRFKFYKHYVFKVNRGCNYIDLNIKCFLLMGMHNGTGLSSVSISDMPIRWLLVLTESEDGLYFVFVYVCSIL